MSTLSPDKTPEHRSRELMNLLAWAGRCAGLPDVDEVERRRWGEEARRTSAELSLLASLGAGWALGQG